MPVKMFNKRRKISLFLTAGATLPVKYSSIDRSINQSIEQSVATSVWPLQQHTTMESFLGQTDHVIKDHLKLRKQMTNFTIYVPTKSSQISMNKMHRKNNWHHLLQSEQLIAGVACLFVSVSPSL